MDTTCREQLAGLDSTLPPSELLENCTGLPGFLNDSCCPLSAEEPGDGWIFDRRDVKVVLVIAYSMVFCCCFFGNLLVIGVVIMNRRMRTTTNFFLTNLAVADLCVAMFCVFQNLFFYLTPQWVFGDFLCRMYFFVHGLSYTASILILTVICAERYLAIVHPMLNKQVVTMTRLRVTIVTVWFVSAAYCSPRIVMYGTVEAVVDDKREALCVLQRALYDSKTYDLVNFVVCFLVPLIIISVLYAIICYQLWHSQAIVSQPQNHIAAQTNHQLVLNPTLCHQKSHSQQRIAGTPPPCRRSCSDEDSESPPPVDSKLEYAQTFVTASSSAKEPCSKTTVALTVPYSNSTQRIADGHQVTRGTSGCNRCGSVEAPTTRKVPVKTFYYANSAAASALRPRRKVIRLLVAVVFSFALCNLPFHARKLWQHWSPEYNGSSPGAAILTVVTNLVLYLNSGINPFLYALFSKNFRQCMGDVLFCRNHRFRSKSRSSFQAMSKSLNSNVSQGTPQAAHLVHGHRQAMQQQHL